MGENIKIISWNVRGLNCPNKKGDVRWLLLNFFCEIAILLESMMEDVNHRIAMSLRGQHLVN